MYQTLYRKYRPTNFDEVVGQKVIIKTLKNALSNNTLTHAYLFTGPRGTGKTSIAKILAKTVNCTNLKDYLPCNDCQNCIQYNNKQAIDIIEIDAASNNGVEEIRELKSKISLVPSIGKYKIYIIDEVHMLSTGAFNALLKTLEEPPNHVIFVLATTDPHKIPSTILSRCQRFDFKKISIKEIVERLKYVVQQEKIKIDDIALSEIAHLSDGGMRDALSLLDQSIAYSEDKITLEDIHEINGTITSKELCIFIKYIFEKNISSIFDRIEEYNSKGKDFVKLLEEIILFLRNLLIKMNVPNYFDESESFVVEEEFLKQINLYQLLDYIKECNNYLYEMKNSNHPKIMFELLIVKIINLESKKIDGIKKIDELKNINNDNINQAISKLNKEEDKIFEKINKEKISKIKKIRINNTLCNFNKKELLKFKNKISDLKHQLLNPKYSEMISIILDGELKAIGENHIIIVFDNDKLSQIFNENIYLIDKIFEDTYHSSMKTIAVNDEEWNVIKQQFNNKEKEYKYIEEII